MTTYRTMTVGGAYGADVTADTDQGAEAAANAAGFFVLDIVDGDDAPILVVDPDATCYHCGRGIASITADGPTEGCLCDPAA